MSLTYEDDIEDSLDDCDEDDSYDDGWDNYDICYECRSYGDDYYFDEYGEIEWRCLKCPLYCQDVGY